MSTITLLDGGNGQELIRRAGEPPDNLWSTTVMVNHPDLVRDVHRDYIAAGSRVLTVNAYTLTRPRLGRGGLEHLLEALLDKALALAEEARDAAPERVDIAACLPPLAASYHAEVVPSEADCTAQYRELVELQADRVDVFMAETLTTSTEARAVARAVAPTGKPLWLGMTLSDDGSGRLRGGETVVEVIAAVGDLPVAAWLVNCSHPETVGAAMPALAASGKPFGGYANGFVSVAPLEVGGNVSTMEARKDVSPDMYAAHALGWVAAGASIVGGCCEVGPAHMAKLAERLRAEGHEIAGARHGAA